MGRSKKSSGNSKLSENTASVEKRRKEEEADVLDESGAKATSSGDVSLSVEETNKLREKLGLKPLEGADGSGKDKGSAKKDEVFVQTENIGKKKKEEKMRQRLADYKESRRMKEKLGGVKGLGDVGEEDVSASDWIVKLRKMQEEKQMADKRAKMLEEMDEEFVRDDYGSKDLKGLTVQHDQTMFTEGKAVVLTLKDADVLASEEGDVLVNLNMLDDERVAKNLELRKGKPDYNPYDDNEVDEDGMLKEKILLEKYEKVDKPDQPKSFQLGADGGIDMEEIEREKKLREFLKIRGESLDYKRGHVSSEYFTQEEMVQFKRPKKKRKVQRKVLKADDLLGLTAEEGGGHGGGKRDHGSRKRKRETESGEGAKMMKVKIDQNVEKMKIDVDLKDDELVFSEEDEAEAELQKALERSRRLQTHTQREGGIKRVGEMMSKVKEEPKEVGGASGSNIELSSIAEFCRTVGESTIQDYSNVRSVKVEEMETESAGDGNGNDSDEEHLFEASEEMESKEAAAAAVAAYRLSDHATSAGFEAEPVVGSSIGAALQMATRKGLIEVPEQAKRFDKKFEFVDRDKAQHVVIEASSESGFQRDFRDRRDHRYDGPHFREKHDYKPRVDIKYINEKGEEMTPKEAFRFMSHKFHGKNPGKLKIEKRSKKKLDNEMLKKMSCIDTPLNTVAMMQEKQKQSHAPFVVLSGGARQFASLPPVAKK